jgi:hypothetical protein
VFEEHAITEDDATLMQWMCVSNSRGVNRNEGVQFSNENMKAKLAKRCLAEVNATAM